MIKLMLNAIIFSLILTSCDRQIKLDKQAQSLDTIKPEVNIKVQKIYDSEGNLISVDSIYSYFYSNIQNDSLQENLIFEKFKFDFNNEFKSFDSIFMTDFLKENPIRIKDFYTHDFFQNNFKSHQKRIERIFKEMDSLKNSFYNDQNEIFKKKKKNI